MHRFTVWKDELVSLGCARHINTIAMGKSIVGGGDWVIRVEELIRIVGFQSEPVPSVSKTKHPS